MLTFVSRKCHCKCHLQCTIMLIQASVGLFIYLHRKFNLFQSLIPISAHAFPFPCAWWLEMGHNCIPNSSVDDVEEGILNLYVLKGKIMDQVDQYHGFWCPGDARSQGISSHGIGIVRKVDLCPSLHAENYTYLGYLCWVGGAVSFLVVGTIGKEERPPRGQLWMEQCLTSLKYWPI